MPSSERHVSPNRSAGPTKTYTIAVSAVITAQPSACYEALADFRVAHPKIVPPQYFGPLKVVAGGSGAGTRTTCSLRIMGQTHPFTSEITEPVPGRVMVETIVESGAVTTFTVVGDGVASARVTIETRMPRGAGVMGALERMITRRVFPRIYTEELGRLASYVRGVVTGKPSVLLYG